MVNQASEEIIEKILAYIPQQKPFRFIDKILELSEDHCIGEYAYKEDEFFYKGHFPGNPITPGVILTETMAQIGLLPIACYKEFLKMKKIDDASTHFLGETNIEFLKVVLPKELIVVRSKMLYYRHGKIKAELSMENKKKEIVCMGTIAGFKVAN